MLDKGLRTPYNVLISQYKGDDGKSTQTGSPRETACGVSRWEAQGEDGPGAVAVIF